MTRLPFSCPVCGAVAWAGLSLSMQQGRNVGHGTCPTCRTFLALRIAPGGQTMTALRWRDYRYKAISGLPAHDPAVLCWRADRLLEQVKAGEITLTAALSYAFKQPSPRIFLAALTFAPGAREAFAAYADAHEAKGGRRIDRHYYAARVAVLRKYFTRTP